LKTAAGANLTDKRIADSLTARKHNGSFLLCHDFAHKKQLWENESDTWERTKLKPKVDDSLFSAFDWPTQQGDRSAAAGEV
jgi:hypothetical protein